MCARLCERMDARAESLERYILKSVDDDPHDAFALCEATMNRLKMRFSKQDMVPASPKRCRKDNFIVSLGRTNPLSLFCAVLFFESKIFPIFDLGAAT